MPWLLSLLLAVLELVHDGRSGYRIWPGAAPSPAERRAAAELETHIAAMTGARLEVVEAAMRPAGKLVRLEWRPDLGAEQFLWRADGTDLVITGGRPRGVLYGVYTLLDHWGVRWYTREVTRIPQLSRLQVKLDREVLQGPAFEYREPFFTEAWDKDWAARNRTNGHFQELDESTGGRLRYQPFVHSFYELLPPEKYFAAHPEFYSWIDGKRRWERAQLCLTNPVVIQLAVEKVRQWITDYPEARIFSVSQNDWEGWCECDRCRRVEQEEGGEHSGPLLRFVNAVAEEIEKTHPDRLIDTLAYWYTENPPLKVRPRPNVRIRLCPIGVCQSHPYEKCPRSAYFMKNLRAWSRITNQLYIWHYNTNFAHYLLPFPDFDELAADIPMYHRHGVVGLFLEGAYPKGGGGEMAELRSWVMARQLWDVNTNVDAAVTEFLEGVYGSAAKPLRAYFDLLHRRARQPDAHLWIFNLPDYGHDFVPQAEKLFAAAMAAAKDGESRRRVEKQQLPVEYLKLLEARRYEIRGDKYGPADLAGLRDRFQTLLAKLRSFGITSIHEGRDLDFDEKDYAALDVYPVISLENEALRVDIVPRLSGRVIRLWDKRARRNLLRDTDPGERGYPDVGGAMAWAHADYQARAWPADWQLEMAEPGRVSLTGAVSNGLRLRRLLRLEGEELVVDSILENPTGQPVEAALRAGADLNPGDIDRARVAFRRRDGTLIARRLIEPEKPPTGNEVWSGDGLPDGLWRIDGGGISTAQRFSLSEVERAALSWTAKGAWRASLSLWSQVTRLGPGERLRLSERYHGR
jgi:hypothetical protein